MVTPEDAERIALAQSEGEIMLVLRNPLDTEVTTSAGVKNRGSSVGREDTDRTGARRQATGAETRSGAGAAARGRASAAASQANG